MRINQFIAECGICSRREADRLIEAGCVTLNGERAVLGAVVSDADTVCVNGSPITRKEEKVYLLLYKPKGVTCTTDPRDAANIVKYVGYPTRLFMVGRLDKESEGAILLTNDGDCVNAVLRSKNEHKKTYRVRTDKPITPEFLKQMGAGVEIFNPVADKTVVTKPCQVSRRGAREFEITLTQGYNRQIRRMCEKLGYRVVGLLRISFLFLTLEGMQKGKWRHLTGAEIAKIESIKAASDKLGYTLSDDDASD